MGLKKEILELINLHQEGPYWDFKKEWYGEDKDSDQLIDIICMANNLVNRDAYIIIGVDEEKDYKLCDVRQSHNRRNTQMLTDFVRSKRFAGDFRPVVTVETLKVGCTQIDVIVIHNSTNTPFFLKERYKGVNANNIYVRLQDSNTPCDRSADFHQIEYLGMGVKTIRLEMAKAADQQEIVRKFNISMYFPGYSLSYPSLIYTISAKRADWCL